MKIKVYQEVLRMYKENDYLVYKKDVCKVKEVRKMKGKV